MAQKFKAGAKVDVAAKEMITIKMNPTTLHRGKKKDALRAYQKPARPHLLEAQVYKSLNFSFEKKVSVTHALEGSPRELIP